MERDNWNGGKKMFGSIRSSQFLFLIWALSAVFKSIFPFFTFCFVFLLFSPAAQGATGKRQLWGVSSEGGTRHSPGKWDWVKPPVSPSCQLGKWWGQKRGRQVQRCGAGWQRSGEGPRESSWQRPRKGTRQSWSQQQEKGDVCRVFVRQLDSSAHLTRDISEKFTCFFF